MKNVFQHQRALHEASVDISIVLAFVARISAIALYLSAIFFRILFVISLLIFHFVLLNMCRSAYRDVATQGCRLPIV